MGNFKVNPKINEDYLETTPRKRKRGKIVLIVRVPQANAVKMNINIKKPRRIYNTRKYAGNNKKIKNSPLSYNLKKYFKAALSETEHLKK